MEEKLCFPCEETIIEKSPPCPLQCGSQRCKSYPLKPPIDTQKVPIVCVLGGPGSGKATQCQKIIAKYGFVHLSTGDLLRAEVNKGTERFKCLTSIMERGELLPNDVVLDLLTEAIETRRNTAKGFVIEGYPRERSQGIAFERAVAPITVILYLEASIATLTHRLLHRVEALEGRTDENEHTIKMRLNTFMDNNDCVIAQYPHKIKRLDAEKSADAIFVEVQKVLDPIVAKAAELMKQTKTPSADTKKQTTTPSLEPKKSTTTPTPH